MSSELFLLLLHSPPTFSPLFCFSPLKDTFPCHQHAQTLWNAGIYKQINIDRALSGGFTQTVTVDCVQTLRWSSKSSLLDFVLSNSLIAYLPSSLLSAPHPHHLQVLGGFWKLFPSFTSAPNKRSSLGESCCFISLLVWRWRPRIRSERNDVMEQLIWSFI